MEWPPRQLQQDGMRTADGEKAHPRMVSAGCPDGFDDTRGAVAVAIIWSAQLAAECLRYLMGIRKLQAAAPNRSPGGRYVDAASIHEEQVTVRRIGQRQPIRPPMAPNGKAAVNGRRDLFWVGRIDVRQFEAEGERLR